MADTVLVTGCSSGIGRATARAFLADGWTTYATARDPGDLTGLADRGAETTRLDVTDPADARLVVARVEEEQGAIDCLVNVAGYGQFGPVEDVPTELVEEQLAVNAVGPHRLMRAVLPAMRERDAGRIVNVTSAGDRLALAGIGVYNGSKMALAGMTDALRQELAHTGVEVVVVQPGAVATPFYDRALAEVERADGSRTYSHLYRALRRIRAVEAGGPGIAEPETVAATILDAATDQNPDTHYRVSQLSLLGSLYGTLVPGTVRDLLTRLAIRAVASGPVQRWLTRREEAADREPASPDRRHL
ncbi:oxidoreductase [Halobacteriales archaeon QS_1_68_20]|nr:MAG: oxidoreductase [Halobacteriales archaeon QS_1_68_20]